MEWFGRVRSLLLGAVAVVAVVMGLFGSFLQNLAPPTADQQAVTGFVSFVSVIVLLCLSLILPRVLSRATEVTFGAIALFAVAVLLFAFPVQRAFVEKYVYLYPPGELPATPQIRLIAGELSPEGRARAQGMELGYAVFRHGGPDIVNERQILWTDASRREVTARLILGYEILVGAAVTTLFVPMVLATGRFQRASGKRPEKS